MARFPLHVLGSTARMCTENTILIYSEHNEGEPRRMSEGQERKHRQKTLHERWEDEGNTVEVLPADEKLEEKLKEIEEGREDFDPEDEEEGEAED